MRSALGAVPLSPQNLFAFNLRVYHHSPLGSEEDKKKNAKTLLFRGIVGNLDWLPFI
jgi:hypothetical protein